MVPTGSAHRFGSMAKGDRLSCVLGEEVSFDRGRWVAWCLGGGVSWMPRDTRDPFQSWMITLSPSRISLIDRCEAILVSWSLRLMQMLPVCWFSLDDVFGRIMVSSLVSHVVVGRGLCRNVAFARCFPFQGADDCTPQVASADHTSDDISSLDLLFSEFGNVQVGSETHVADASPGLGSQVTSCWSESFLVVQMVLDTKMMTK